MNAPSLLAAELVVGCCEDEKWDLIPDWTHHEASSCGQVRMLDHLGDGGRLRLGGLLPQHPDRRKGKGYLYVNLRDGSRHRHAAVAVLVLEAHRGLRPGPGYEASHLYGIRTDNHLSGLAWETRAQNLARIAQHAAEREAAAVTPPPGETPRRLRSQVRRGCGHFRPRRYGVTAARRGNAAKGTGRSPSILTFRPHFPSFNPLTRTVRNLWSRTPR